jgi:hypothetical protein
VENPNSFSIDFAQSCDGDGLSGGVFPFSESGVFSAHGSLTPTILLDFGSCEIRLSALVALDDMETLVVVLDNGSVNKVLSFGSG